MAIMVREQHPHARTLWLPVTPELRRILALVAETAIDLLDEIDRPAAELEADADFEEADPLEEDDAAEEDDFREDGHDAEPEEGDADLGWTEDGIIGNADNGYDADIVEPETSGGFRRLHVHSRDPQRDPELRAMFDPRLAARPSFDGHQLPPFNPRLPTFPWEPASRAPCETRTEIGRIHALVIAMQRRERRSKRSLDLSGSRR